jgi:hypothetical protein
MKLDHYTPRPAGAALAERLPAAGNPAGRARGMASAQQDNELQHSFAPGEIGFDFLPLDVPSADAPPVPTSPRNLLPVLDLNSTGPLPELGANGREVRRAGDVSSPVRQSHREADASRSPGRIWLDGDAIFCACPDCRAPMSVRIYLMIADCWRCGASIELSDEQEREVNRLLAERDRQQRAAAPAPPLPRPATAPPPAPVAAQAALATPSPPPSPPAARAPSSPQAPPAPARFRGAPPPPPASSPAAPPAPARPMPGAQPSPPRPAQQRRAAPQPYVRRQSWTSSLLHDTPAWLISMLIHLVALTLLAILTAEKDEDEGPHILLSANVRLDRDRGGDPVKIEPEDLAKFDLPLPEKADLTDNQERAALLAAAQDARELRLDDDTPNLPELATLKSRVGTADGYAVAVAARDPRLRVEMVTKEGGTTMTEAAVARGLRWLANHQNSDGSWSISGFHAAGQCNCSGPGAFGGKSPGTALAMLPFLGAGQTHLAGRYQDTVSRGLRWMIQNQKEDGDLRAGSNGNEGMYTHGQATIVLCEAFAMTGDEELRIPAQKAVDFVLKAQYTDGGWRYTPAPRTQPGDTSVVGWQLMALQSARSANLTVPDEAWGMADLYMDSVSHLDGALYSYQARGGPTPTMTAEGLLCRMYLGWTKERPGLVNGVEYLTANHLPRNSEPNIYYWYYATQVMHHYGGPEWDEWNTHMRDILVQSQERGGHEAGSWSPRGDHAGAGGRIYMTSLATCTLEVYYRHLPIFRQIELDQPAP